MLVPSRAVTLTSRDGTRIAARLHEPLAFVGTVVLCHGIGEHSGRYAHLVASLGAAQMRCLTFDFRGHGGSAGLKGHVSRFGEYLDDLDAALHYLTSLRSTEPWFLFGHSMGGVVVTRYLQTRAAPKPLRGLILSSPGFEVAMAVPRYKRTLSRCLLRVAPRFRVDSGIRSRHLTSVREAQQLFERDPLTYSSITLRWFDEFQRAAASCMVEASAVTISILVCVGAADKVIEPAAARRFVALAATTDKTLLSWEGHLHEPLQDAQAEEVTRAIVNWTRERTAAARDVTPVSVS